MAQRNSAYHLFFVAPFAMLGGMRIAAATAVLAYAAASTAFAEIPAEYIPILQKVYQSQKNIAKDLHEQIDVSQRQLRQFESSIPKSDRPRILKERQEKLTALKSRLANIESNNRPEIGNASLAEKGSIGSLRISSPIAENVDGKEVIAKYTYDTIHFNYASPATYGTRDADVRIIFLKPQKARIGEAITLPDAVEVTATGDIPTVTEIDWGHVTQFYQEYLKSIGAIK